MYFKTDKWKIKWETSKPLCTQSYKFFITFVVWCPIVFCIITCEIFLCPKGLFSSYDKDHCLEGNREKKLKSACLFCFFSLSDDNNCNNLRSCSHGYTPSDDSIFSGFLLAPICRHWSSLFQIYPLAYSCWCSGTLKSVLMLWSG